MKGDSGTGKFSIGIDHWEIVDDELVYDDKSIRIPFPEGLNHAQEAETSPGTSLILTHTVADSVSTAMVAWNF